MLTKKKNRHVSMQLRIVTIILISSLIFYQHMRAGKHMQWKKDMRTGPAYQRSQDTDWPGRDDIRETATILEDEQMRETDMDNDINGELEAENPNNDSVTTQEEKEQPLQEEEEAKTKKNETITYENVSHGFKGDFKSDPSHPFNNHNPHQHWCPKATCLNSPICQPCQKRYLLILATARSGSTTLLRMFGALPSVRLAGENLNTLEPLSLVIDNLIKKRSDQGPVVKANGRGRIAGPFTRHPIPHGSYACPTQHWINALNPPPHHVMLRSYTQEGPTIEEYDEHTIMGFKSVRFHLSHWTVQEGAKFLRENFPCSKIIINMRSNVQSQMESVGTTFMRDGNTEDELENELVQYNSFQRALSQELGSDVAKLIDMNDWKEDVSVLNDVIDWLGFEGCAFRELVHENHDGYGRDTDHDVDLGANCRYTYK